MLLQGRLSHLESDNVLLKRDNMSFIDRITVLENSSALLTNIRNRFLSIFKRDYMAKESYGDTDREFKDLGNIDAQRIARKMTEAFAERHAV